MAMQLPRKIQTEIRAISGNSECVDCSGKYPQWASVSYGTLFCLQCSGRHRSLGVHLSFVRSIQMDSWTEPQIQTLRVGGNQRMKDFFAKYKVPTTLSIKQKYDTVQAEAYRERILALRDGKSPPSTQIPIYRPPSPRADGLSEEEAARQRMRAKFGGQSGMGNSNMYSSRRQPKQSGPDWDKIRSGFSSAWSSAAESTGKWTKDVRAKTGQWTKDIKAKMDDAKLGEKFKIKPVKVEDAAATLKSGWSWFSKGAANVWTKASDGVKKLAQKEDDGPLQLYRTDRQMREGVPKLYREDPRSNAKTVAGPSSKSSAKSSVRNNKNKTKNAASKISKFSIGEEDWGDDWGDDWTAGSAPAATKKVSVATQKIPAATQKVVLSAADEEAWEKDVLDLGMDEDVQIDDDDTLGEDLLANFDDVDLDSTNTAAKDVSNPDTAADEASWENDLLDLGDDEDVQIDDDGTHDLQNIDIDSADKPPQPPTAPDTKDEADFFSNFGV